MSIKSLQSKFDNTIISGIKYDENYLAYISLSIPLIFLLVFTGVPLVYVFYLSLMDTTLLAVDYDFVGMENYQSLSEASLFFDSLVNGVIFAIGATALQIMLGLSLALFLNKKFIGSSILRTLVIFTYLAPMIAVAMIWSWMLDPHVGLLNQYLIQFGVISDPISFFGNTTLAMPTIIIVSSWKFTAFAFLIFLARLQSIDESEYELAKIYGATTFQMFRTITLPHLWKAILLVVLLRTIWMFNRCDVVWLLTRGGPYDSTTTLPVYIYQTAFIEFDLAMASAASIVLFFTLSVIAVVYFWRFKPSQEVEV